MPRPNKNRKIYSNPGVYQFKPIGAVTNDEQIIELSLDEFEAIRLADFEGYYQDKAAEMMNVSRQTFGNIITSAHKKLADFIINAKTLKIIGGNIEFIINDGNFVCFGCKFIGIEKCDFETFAKCPHCVNPHLHKINKQKINE